MNLGEAVFQNYGGLHRYGKVIEVKENLKGDGWKWVKVDWVDDDRYENSQRWKANMRGEHPDYFIPEYYRSDDLQTINLNDAIHTLLRLKELI